MIVENFCFSLVLGGGCISFSKVNLCNDTLPISLLFCAELYEIWLVSFIFDIASSFVDVMLGI